MRGLQATDPGFKEDHFSIRQYRQAIQKRWLSFELNTID